MNRICELGAKQGKVMVEGEVLEVGTVREYEKFGKKGKVANAKIKDNSGEISLTLWNDEVDKVKKGCKIKIINGYVNEWQGQKQLTTGRFGNLEVI